MSSALITDALKKLSEENKRLLTELTFANKCLKVLIEFKVNFDLYSHRFKTVLKSDEWQKLKQLVDNVNQVIFNRPQLNPSSASQTMTTDKPLPPKKRIIKIVKKSKRRVKKSQTSQPSVSTRAEVVTQSAQQIPILQSIVQPNSLHTVPMASNPDVIPEVPGFKRILPKPLPVTSQPIPKPVVINPNGQPKGQNPQNPLAKESDTRPAMSRFIKIVPKTVQNLNQIQVLVSPSIVTPIVSSPLVLNTNVGGLVGTAAANKTIFAYNPNPTASSSADKPSKFTDLVSKFKNKDTSKFYPHKRTRKFVCDYCGKGFVRYPPLINHMTKYHPSRVKDIAETYGIEFNEDNCNKDLIEDRLNAQNVSNDSSEKTLLDCDYTKCEFRTQSSEEMETKHKDTHLTDPQKRSRKQNLKLIAKDEHRRRPI